MFIILLSLLGLIARANILDDYVSAEESKFNWYQVENNTFKTLYGGTAYVLNVTSLEWLDESIYVGP